MASINISGSGAGSSNGSKGGIAYFRPRYNDHLACPASVEFGVLLPESKLWAEEFQLNCDYFRAMFRATDSGR
jgi:hypothetical protein